MSDNLNYWLGKELGEKEKEAVANGSPEYNTISNLIAAHCKEVDGYMYHPLALFRYEDGVLKQGWMSHCIDPDKDSGVQWFDIEGSKDRETKVIP